MKLSTSVHNLFGTALSQKQRRAKTRNSRMRLLPLEDRITPSTINWTNRNDFSGITDNRFDDVFGLLASQAIAVVDASIAQWQRVVQSFDYSSGFNEYALAIYCAGAPLTTGSGVGAGANVNPNFVDGKPVGAAITINYRAIANSGDTSSGWWLDPSPMDNSEFDGVLDKVTSAWVGVPTTSLGGADLFTGMLHEIGHAMGLYSNAQMNLFVTDTKVVDNVNGPASSPASNFWRFDSPNAHTLFTAWNSTGGTGMAGNNTAGSEHTAPAGITPIVQNNRTYYGFTDLMNANFTNRSLITDTHARMLQDAFGYKINLPSRFGTFYDRLDADGTLTILTPANGPDIVALEVVGTDLHVSMSIGNPVVGADPTSINSVFPLGAINSINIFTREGADHVTISPIVNTIPISMYLGSDNDVLELNGTTGYDSATVGSTVIITSIADISYIDDVNSLILNTGLGNADVSVLTSSFPVTVNAFGGNELIVLHKLDWSDSVTVNGNGGNDTITVAPDGVSFDVQGSVIINGGSGNDVINLAPIANGAANITAPIVVNGGTGNDTLNLTNGNLDALTGLVTFDGGGENDRIVLNDQSPLGSYSYDITAVSITRNPLFAGLNYSGVNWIVLNCGGGANTIRVGAGVTAIVEAYGNGGNDTIEVGGGNMTGYFPQVLDGGAGTDQIIFDDHLNPDNQLWDINQDFHPDEVIYDGFIILSTFGCESVGILAGAGSDTITFHNVVDQNYTVNGGGGSDSFVLGLESKELLFSQKVTLQGGDGNDIFTVNNAGLVNLPQVGLVGSLIMEGGEGFNSLNVVQPLATGYEIDAADGAGYILPSEDGNSRGKFRFNAINTCLVTGTESDNTFSIYSAGISFGTFQIDGGYGDDSFILAPRPTGYTFEHLTVNGQVGDDTFTLNATALLTDENYTVSTNSVTIIHGVSSQTISATSMAQINLNAGSGNDTITINQYTAGIPVAINCGSGADSVYASPVAAPVSIEGGDPTTEPGDILYLDLATNQKTLGSPANGSVTGPGVGTLSYSGFETRGFAANNTKDSGAGSLREAIINANNPGRDIIQFNIPGAGVHSITPLTALPTITDATIIDGYSQPGSSVNTLAVGNNAVLLIELNGANANFSGLTIASGGSTVQGLVINRFLNNGLVLQSKGGNLITGNFIGTDATGTTALINQGGIYLNQSPGNTIGGTSPAARNVILGNSNPAIFTPNFGETVGGNIIQGNYIGSNAAGTAVLGNTGISLYGANNVIGGTSTGAGNVISTQARSAISFLEGNADNNVVQGNYIGLTAAGTAILGNGSDGVTIQRSDGNLIGGLTPEARNIIVSRTGVNISASGGVAQNNTIQGNYFGTDPTGTIRMEVPASSAAVLISSGSNNIVGGMAAGAGNLIASFAAGVQFNSAASGNFVYGNLIGTNAAGSAGLGNGVGIMIASSGATGNVIGGLSAGMGNVISGNSSSGIVVQGFGTNPGSTIQGNLIGLAPDGVSARGNLANGILISTGNNNNIGGTATNAGNTIAFNGASGVLVQTGCTGNSILGNSIYSNIALGIDLTGNGVTPNDAGDTDTGANNLQNYPVILTAQLGLSTHLIGTLNSTATTNNIRIEFFASAAADPSGFGEGRRYLGSTMVNTNSSGDAAYDVTLPVATSAGEWITATATDALGNTSEFSKARPGASLTVTGITINDGSLQRSRVTSLVVTFDQPPSLPGVPADAFQLKRNSDNAIVTLNAVPSGNTVTLTFTGGPVTFGSLADGRYTLTVSAAQITNLDGNDDGTAGDDYTLVGNPATNTLFRLFGDSNGDGTVNGTDFLAFRLAFLQPSSAFDFDGDGQVAGTDFLQFRLRFLQSV